MFSLTDIARRFPGRIALTLLLVVAEALLGILFPLFIGWAVNDLVDSSYTGLLWLGGLGLLSLFIGSARRFYDTRIYSHIYTDYATRMVSEGKRQQLSLSQLSARSGLLTELVEFFEHSVPEIVFSLIGVVGVLGIVLTLNAGVFVACLGLLFVMTTVYLVTGNRQYRFHGQYNQVMEQRVDALAHATPTGRRAHFMQLMRWNIKLSDMETLNFGVIWLAVIALLVAAPVLTVSGADVTPEVGTLLAILIYVFDYSEKVVSLPYFVQQLIRLQEISDRLNAGGTAASK